MSCKVSIPFNHLGLDTIATTTKTAAKANTQTKTETTQRKENTITCAVTVNAEVEVAHCGYSGCSVNIIDNERISNALNPSVTIRV